MNLENYNPNLSSPPKPDYCKCNAGHQLHLFYNPLYDRNQWDCMICFLKMDEANTVDLKYEITVNTNELDETHERVSTILSKLFDEGKISDWDGYM